MLIKLEDLQQTLNQMYKDMKEDCTYIGRVEIVDTPKGSKQDYEYESKLFDHEYCSQSTGYCGDDYSGYMYYPFHGKYLKVEYSC